MPNIINGIEYRSNLEKITREEQLLEVFRELKDCFQQIHRTYIKLTSVSQQPVATFQQFLEVAVSSRPQIILNCEGNVTIFGLRFDEPAILEYKLYDIARLTKNWDEQIDGSCRGCTQHYNPDEESGQAKHLCAIEQMDYLKHCPKYDPLRKNARGKPARSLAKLILEASSEPKPVEALKP